MALEQVLPDFSTCSTPTNRVWRSILPAPDGRRQLCALLACADIVIESARPRALEHMGIQAADIVRAGAGRVWLSITGYGRGAPMRDWIAFGDDAGVAAGLSWLLRKSSGSNVFCGDAIADPLTGLHAALLAWAAWTQGGGVLLDVSLYGVLARCIAAGCPTGSIGVASRVTRRSCHPGRGPHRGRLRPWAVIHAEVLLEFGIR